MAKPSDEFRRRLESWKDAREIGEEIEAEITGKFQAQADEQTPTDPPRRQTDPPKSGIPGLISAVTTGAARIVSAVNNAYALLALALLVAAFIAWLRLRP